MISLFFLYVAAILLPAACCISFKAVHHFKAHEHVRVMIFVIAIVITFIAMITIVFFINTMRIEELYKELFIAALLAYYLELFIYRYFKKNEKMILDKICNAMTVIFHLGKKVLLLK